MQADGFQLELSALAHLQNAMNVQAFAAGILYTYTNIQ